MPVVQTYPRKLFYKINEVAEIVGVEAYVLRYWETKFPMLKPERFGNDERRYRQRDIDLLLRIRTLLYEEKYTIAGAVERIRKDPKGDRQEAIVEIITEHEEPEVEDADRQLSLFSSENRELIVNARERLAHVRAELLALKGEMQA